MVLDYFKSKKGKQTAPTAVKEAAPKSPVLTKEDEDFLKRLTAEDEAEAKGQIVIFDKDNGTIQSTDAQTRLMDGADSVPLPMSPPKTEVENPIEQTGTTKKDKDKAKRKSYLAFFQNKMSSLPFGKDNNKKQTGTDLQKVADAVKTGESLAEPPKVVTKEEADKEKQDINGILDKLNLSAINNRAFSFSQESQKLFEEFTQILKDIINGVPTAYDDLEKLLTRSDKELKGMYNSLPPFIQNLIKTLPAKLTGTIAPGLLAAASEKPGADAKLRTASTSKISKKNIPYLKSLMTTDAIVAALRSIISFLKVRFPTFLAGTNVLLSLAVFLLLFVFWYCHKRGRETRLEKEKLSASQAGSELESSSSAGSSIHEGQAGPSTEDAKVEAALNQPAPSTVPLPATADKGLS